MPYLKDKETGTVIGQISDEQLQFLIDHLEEESSTDRDYYLNQTTIEMLREAGADINLVEMMSKALQNHEGIEIEWL
jgi:hypothetical protein